MLVLHVPVRQTQPPRPLATADALLSAAMWKAKAEPDPVANSAAKQIREPSSTAKVRRESPPRLLSVASLCN